MSRVRPARIRDIERAEVFCSVRTPRINTKFEKSRLSENYRFSILRADLDSRFFLREHFTPLSKCPQHEILKALLWLRFLARDRQREREVCCTLFFCYSRVVSTAVTVDTRDQNSKLSCFIYFNSIFFFLSFSTSKVCIKS